MNKFKWAFIGSGAIAKLVATELVESEGHEIVSVYSKTLTSAQEFASSVGATAYGSIAEAMKDADGAYICSLNNVHLSNALEVFACGKPALIEKPLTENYEDTVKIFEAAEKAGVYVSEAMWTSHNEMARKVREWSKTRVGMIRHITMDLRYNLLAYEWKRARLLSREQGGGAMRDMGIYALTYCYNILGYPDKIKCKFRWQDGVDLGGKIRLRYNDGAVCDILLAIDREEPEFAIIKGSEGKILVPKFHKCNRAQLYAEKSETFEQSWNYLVQFDNVANEIRSGLLTGKVVSAKSSMEIMRLIEECLDIAGRDKEYAKCSDICAIVNRDE